MMEIVIKIPEGLKDVFENRNVTALDVEEMRMAIKNGTPLSEHHGRLIDADAIPRHLVRDIDEIDKQPTIIEGSDV